MTMVLLYLLLSLTGLATADRPLYQLSLGALQQAATTGRLAAISHALEDVGGLAVSGLDAEYLAALGRLATNAPTCQDGALEVRLEDGTVRRTHVRTTNNPETASAAFPDCVSKDVAVITQAFDAVEKVMVWVLARLLGNASLEVLDGGRSLDLLELPTKTHLHVYNNAETAADQQQPEAKQKLSLPFHVDNGLYLLLTPAAALPLRMRSKTGRNIRTAQAGPDTVLFLLGRGLTDWLVPQQADSRITPARHAVPSLAGTTVPSRTVVARMRVAPLAAVARTTRQSFGEIFLDGRVAPSMASLCYYGGPFNEQEASLRARRSAAACWPHTEKC